MRERNEDISLLAHRFIEKYNELLLFQMEVKGLDEEVIQSFLAYDWPGNVRELEHIIEVAMNIMIDEEVIKYSHLPFHYRNKLQTKERIFPVSSVESFINEIPDATVHLKDQMESFEKYYIEQKNNCNISRTAKLLGLSRQSLQYRMKKLNIINI